VLSTLTAAVMGKRALSSRQLVKSLEVVNGTPIPTYTNHYQTSLAAYANPKNIKWMPGGCVRLSRSLIYYPSQPFVCSFEANAPCAGSYIRDWPTE
jgi:hypothetical protein